MMYNNFFRINMPYGIKGNNKDGWHAFNREYQPLGETIYSKNESKAKYRDLDYKFIGKLNELGCLVLPEGENTTIFFYSEGTIPESFKPTLKKWVNYFEVIRLVAKLKD